MCPAKPDWNKRHGGKPNCLSMMLRLSAIEQNVLVPGHRRDRHTVVQEVDRTEVYGSDIIQ